MTLDYFACFCEITFELSFRFIGKCQRQLKALFLNKCCFLKPHNLFEELLLILVGNNNAKTFRKSFYLFPWLMVSFVRKWKLLKWKINCPKNVFSFCGSLKTFLVEWWCYELFWLLQCTFLAAGPASRFFPEQEIAILAGP